LLIGCAQVGIGGNLNIFQHFSSGIEANSHSRELARATLQFNVLLASSENASSQQDNREDDYQQHAG
jgi:hypothetical protein